jgi:hypothetical protein
VPEDTRRQAAISRKEDSREAFRSHLSQVIKPAFEEAKQMLVRHGITTAVSEQSSRQKEGDLTIGFYVLDDDARPGRPQFPHDSKTHLVFTCNPQTGKVSVYEARQMPGGGSSAGTAGEIPLGEVSADYIHAAILRLLGD